MDWSGIWRVCHWLAPGRSGPVVVLFPTCEVGAFHSHLTFTAQGNGSDWGPLSPTPQKEQLPALQVVHSGHLFSTQQSRPVSRFRCPPPNCQCSSSPVSTRYGAVQVPLHGPLGESGEVPAWLGCQGGQGKAGSGHWQARRRGADKGTCNGKLTDGPCAHIL